METIDTTTLPEASSSEEATPVKSQRNPTISFRPKSGEMKDFVENLVKELGSAQKVIEYCVNLAMMPKNKEASDAFLSFKETEMALRKNISELEAELLKLNTSGVPVPVLELGEDLEKFIRKIINDKNTNREEAIKFCVLYTKKNILWI